MMTALLSFTSFFLALSLFGFAGWYLYRNPVKVLNFVFGQYDFQYGRLGIGFFRGFGIVMVGLAGLTGIAKLLLTLLELFGKAVQS